ncbi:hypothetical protein [Streptomyces silaceus]|uniref:hypothetical protein n=1 Tax=Streptomyces silaceus TaxID=545123 RepID=UPI0012FF2182|nr:hypothetical protein [Streptomyces silaceus]
MIGAIIGAGTALVAAGAGLLGARLGARSVEQGAVIAAEAVARQVHSQAAVDHGHWQREQRATACNTILQSFDDAVLQFRLTMAADGDLEGIEQAATRLQEAVIGVSRARVSVSVAGPPALVQQAENLLDLANSLIVFLQEDLTGREEEAAGLPDRVHEARERFIDTCREELGRAPTVE